MSIENAIRNRSVLLERLGKAVLNVRYPKDFEMYVIALELVDGDSNTLKYFIFPVNPSSIDELETKLTNIKKTAGGVVSLGTTTFNPVDINLSGNFGRKFKILLGSTFTDFISSFKTAAGGLTLGSLAKGLVKTFDDRVKTGYGCLKVLQEMCDEADLIDDKGPRRLIFHNLAFGTSYVVKTISFRTNMGQDTNMIHSYYLQLRALASLDDLQVSGTSDRKTALTTNYIQGQTDRLVNALTKIFT